VDLKIVDQLLTTTRSVRKRLDFQQPVDLATLQRCLEIAMQAPTGSNSQGWHFLVISDAAKRKGLADLYRRAFDGYRQLSANSPQLQENDPRRAQTLRIVDSASYLAEHLHEAPVMVVPCIEGRVENAGVLAQASVYGSILPAVWSLMLALRARGLGSAWTTLHLMFEQDAAALLNLPATITQTALLPVAHFTGTDFRPAKRLPASNHIHWDGWGQRRGI
jgi:nitroreductase